jgi:hypothetical protein
MANESADLTYLKLNDQQNVMDKSGGVPDYNTRVRIESAK